MSAPSRARLLLKNARQVVTVGGGSAPKLGAAMGEVDILADHSLLVDGQGRISQLVPAGAETESLLRSLHRSGGVDQVVDCSGKVVLPGFVDGHTHAVFDGDRSHEHAMKLAGATYEEVHEAGGGINFTVNAVRGASEERLSSLLLDRLDAMMRSGTTTCEVKTGYGLDYETELKMLQVIRGARARHRMGIKASWLVHAVPKGQTSGQVADDVVNDWLPRLAQQGGDGALVDFIDVFCEKGFLDRADSKRILEAGRDLLGADISFHGDELNDLQCGELAAELGARAVSHLEMLNPDGVQAMARAGVHAVLLPTTAYLLRLPLPPTRALIDAGAPVALASDFNPNAFCFDMPGVMNLACVMFGMTMPEALVASTINAASALNVADEVGSLEVGKRGDVLVLDAPGWEHLVYNMRPNITAVYKDGLCVTDGTVQGATRFPALDDAAGGGDVHAADLSSLAKGLPLDPMPPPIDYDAPDQRDVPHAPRRPIEVTPELKRQAITNALRYFPPEHHAELAKDFSAELDRFGHIYMHRFNPTNVAKALEAAQEEEEGGEAGSRRHYTMKAHPITQYPCKSTMAAALMHMIQNNLDPAVAQFPAELVTYGGNGSAFSNWAQYHETMRLLSEMTDEQTLVLYSGHPMGLFPSHKDAPRLVVTNGMVIPNHSGRDDYERMFATGVSQYGQMTAGSFCYIGPQGIVHGTTLTLLNAGRKYLGAQDMRGKVFVTAGLGGMSGAQPKAAVITGAVGICAEVSREAAEKRHAQGWVEYITDDLEEVLAIAKGARDEERGTSIAYVGNIVDLWERLVEETEASGAGASGGGEGSSRPLLPDLGSDQTSCHIPFTGGYYPAGLSYEESQRMMAEDPAAFKDAVQDSLRRQVTAVNKLTDRGMKFWDYGNSFLLEASRAGADILALDEGEKEQKREDQVEAGGEGANAVVSESDLAFRYPSYVEDIMGDIFSLGFGPYRWVCTSADKEDLAMTDAIALDVLNELRDELAAVASDPDDGRADYAARAIPQLDDNILWITEAEEHNLVVGSQARILYANAAARGRMAQAFNEAVADGRLSAPVMLSRDHHDVSGTDSPWRETSNVTDGSKFCADMAVQNVIGDAMRGATSVSLHNGGGTGWGESVNGGFLLCLDGSAEAGKRADNMLHWDVFNGISRRAWAGNDNALSYTAAEQHQNAGYSVPYPHKVGEDVLDAVV